MNIQLPNASSLQRTEAVLAKIQKIVSATPGVESVTAVGGFSLLSFVRASYSGFAWISMKEWGDRKTPRRTVPGNQSASQRRTQQAAGGRRVRILPARHSRSRHVGRSHLHSRRPLRRRTEVSCRKPRQVHGRRAQKAGNRKPDHDVSARAYRSNSSMSTATR